MDHCDCCVCKKARHERTLERIADSLEQIANDLTRYVDFLIKPVSVVVDEGKPTAH